MEKLYFKLKANGEQNMDKLFEVKGRIDYVQILFRIEGVMKHSNRQSGSNGILDKYYF